MMNNNTDLSYIGTTRQIREDIEVVILKLEKAIREEPQYIEYFLQAKDYLEYSDSSLSFIIKE